MNTISLMENTIQKYAWGSHTAIPQLLGEKVPSEHPWAELWMGAHPKSPSKIKDNGNWVSLTEIIANNPRDVLGEKVAEKFNNRLPYLFKVLAAAKPLSIQAHPDSNQAKEGYERENRLKIPKDAYNRNYKDDNHKPECICALTDFTALNGFREISQITSLMEKICPPEMKNMLGNLKDQPDTVGLKKFFHDLLSLNSDMQKQIISVAVNNAKKNENNDPAFKWMIKLYNEYPEDIGIFSPVILNLICLKPGEAMFLQAGELHAYLDGLGIELMANSDNVLRGGLTPKYIDVPELLKVLNFEERKIRILQPEKISQCESIYPCPAEEFGLSVISVEENKTFYSLDKRGVEILFCTQGQAIVTHLKTNSDINIESGKSVFIPAIVEKYSIKGNATFYKASVPF